MYNHHLGKKEFKNLKIWLQNPDNEDIDNIVLQEANERTVEVAKTLIEEFPYQIYEPREHYFGMVVLSRYPFISAEKILLNGSSFQSFALNFSYQPPNALSPLTVYALHPPPPSGPLRAMQRDFELLETARIISDDDTKNILMLGDWNITPFAPAFVKILNESDLNYQSYGLLLNPSWPSFNIFEFLKIPIDHSLYSDNLEQVEKTVGPSFGSDHHSLIVSYIEKK